MVIEIQIALIFNMSTEKENFRLGKYKIPVWILSAVSWKSEISRAGNFGNLADHRKM